MRHRIVRYLEPKDVPALLALEHAKWEANQAADYATLLKRIQTYPELCIGAFCSSSGTALASLFLRPISPAVFTAPTNWDISANLDIVEPVHARSLALFGISLSSNSAEAVVEIFKFFYPRALKAGWRDIYLGSPIPGYRKALAKDPALSVWQYVHASKTTQGDKPRDPQLAYYFNKGFRQIISIQKDYFPHQDSLDYGVILRAIIPLSRPRALWRLAPIALLAPVSALVFAVFG